MIVGVECRDRVQAVTIWKYQPRNVRPKGGNAMRTIIVCMAIVVTLALIGVSLLAQEIVPTPDPIGGGAP